MYWSTRIVTLILVLGISGPDLIAQSDEQVAYVPRKPIARTADDPRIGLADGATPGNVEFKLPEGTYQVDLINSRGAVKHRRSGSSLGQMDLGSLRPGTWTLRAHTKEGMTVRRFMVMQRGRIAWAVPSRIRAR